MSCGTEVENLRADVALLLQDWGPFTTCLGGCKRQ